MYFLRILIFFTLAYLAASYKLTEDNEDIDIENQVDLDIASRHLVSQRSIEPYISGDSPEEYMAKIRATKDCQKEKFHRLNLCAATCREFKVTVTPNILESDEFYALDEAKYCLANEQAPYCTGSKAYITLKNGDQFNIQSKNGDVMRVRQVCAYTFGVQKVKVHFNTPNNGIVTHAWTPQETPNSLFNFGCTTNSNFVKALDFTIELVGENPTIMVKDLYAELCV